MKKVLVIVDMQTGFIEQCRAENIINNLIKKIEKRIKDGYEIILTLDREGGKIDCRIMDICRDSKIYKKHSYGCKELILDLFATNPETVEFVGICTDICVITNVLGTMAFLPFAEIVVDSSCCASQKEGQLAALKVMKSCGVNVI